MSVRLTRRMLPVLIVLGAVAAPAVAASPGNHLLSSDYESLLEYGRSGYAREQLRWLAETAIARSPAVREAKAGQRAARYDLGEAKGALNPQVELSADSRWSSGLEGSGSRDLSGRPSYAVTGSMLLYDGGRTHSLIFSRTAAEQAATARNEGVMLSVTGEAVLVSIELSRLLAQTRAADDYLERIRWLVEMLSKIAAEDPGRQSELTQARSRVLQAQVARDSLAARVEQTRVVLKKYIGTTDRNLDELALVFLETPTLDALLATLKTHPQVLQAIFEADASDGQAKALGAAQKPQVSVVASRAPVSAGLSGDYASYGGFRMTMTLYKGGSDVAAERAAIERAAGARERHEQVLLDRETAVRALHAIAMAQLQRARDYISLLRESEKVRSDFFIQWREVGRRSLFELLSAESEYYSLSISQLDTWFDAIAGLARLQIESGALLGVVESVGAFQERRPAP